MLRSGQKASLAVAAFTVPRYEPGAASSPVAALSSVTDAADRYY